MTTSARTTALGLCLALLPAPVLAADKARADAYRQQAEEAWKNGDSLRALSFMELAYAADPQPALLANRGLILEKLGDTKRALADFEAYLESDPPPEKRATVETAIRRLRPEVVVASDPPGVAVTLDDGESPLGVTPLRLNVPVGAHVAKFERLDGEAAQMAFVVEPGRGQALQLVARPNTVAVPVAASPATATRSRTISYIALATGVAAAAAGGVLTLVMHSTKDDRDAAETRTAWKDLDDEAENYEVGAGAAFGASAVALGTGLYFWFAGE